MLVPFQLTAKKLKNNAVDFRNVEKPQHLVPVHRNETVSRGP